MLDVMHLLAAEPAKPVDQKGVSTSGHVQYNNTIHLQNSINAKYV